MLPYPNVATAVEIVAQALRTATAVPWQWAVSVAAQMQESEAQFKVYWDKVPEEQKEALGEAVGIAVQIASVGAGGSGGRGGGAPFRSIRVWPRKWKGRSPPQATTNRSAAPEGPAQIAKEFQIAKELKPVDSAMHRLCRADPTLVPPRSIISAELILEIRPNSGKPAAVAFLRTNRTCRAEKLYDFIVKAFEAAANTDSPIEIRDKMEKGRDWRLAVDTGRFMVKVFLGSLNHVAILVIPKSSAVEANQFVTTFVRDVLSVARNSVGVNEIAVTTPVAMPSDSDLQILLRVLLTAADGWPPD